MVHRTAARGHDSVDEGNSGGMTDEAKGRYLTRNRGAGFLIALLAALTVLIAPTAWASPATGAEQGATVAKTWVGQVNHHIRHFDYVGAPCPTEVEVCPAVIVKYRIVPTTDQARDALSVVVGHRAEMKGIRGNGDGMHPGVLYVSQVKAA
ncbi:MAG: hypothetical protein ACRDTE_28310 [Pseudonocardiaceae bacterium]